ncbi:hypothetical protein GCM10025858_07290 [Alicyclobacillus sacchari]|nr:hypothetical protein GCM10025858_07290 [Alicyclobacillus sacchari]
MIAYGVLNALFNLLAGHISDRTNTRWGRRIPYIALCSLPFALSFVLLFSPPSLGHAGLLCYFFAMTLAFDLSFTFTALNAGALYPEMFVSQRDRAYVSALQQLFGIIGLIAGVALAKSLGQSLGWRTMGLVFGAIGLLSMYVSLYGSFERKERRERPFGWGRRCLPRSAIAIFCCTSPPVSWSNSRRRCLPVPLRFTRPMSSA